MVLAVDEQMVSGGVQRRLADGTSELKLDDATKIIGCYKALTKHGLTKELLTDSAPMKRAIAFCKDIASSKLVQNEFAAVIAEYLVSEDSQRLFIQRVFIPAKLDQGHSRLDRVRQIAGRVFN